MFDWYVFKFFVNVVYIDIIFYFKFIEFVEDKKYNKRYL